MIRKLASGEYRLYSRKVNPKTGRRRNLGTYKTCAAAEKHPNPARPCLPWALDRQLAGLGMRKIESQACNFIFFPLKELHERACDALNRALTPLSRLAIAPLLGAQYVVKAQKTAWRSA